MKVERSNCRMRTESISVLALGNVELRRMYFKKQTGCAKEVRGNV
jgi:hypothetical protein